MYQIISFGYKFQKMCVAYFFHRQRRLVYVNFDLNAYVPKRVVDPLKLLKCGLKIDILSMSDISVCAIILNKICLLLDTFLGNTICAFSKSFSVLRYMVH